jgi:hypothetical protein
MMVFSYVSWFLFYSRSAVNTWFAAVQTHPSTSKEAINPFSCLATKADHDANAMRDVRINTA